LLLLKIIFASKKLYSRMYIAIYNMADFEVHQSRDCLLWVKSRQKS